ncbi:hypothetical protein C8A00DRAFT_31617 [Chaetomidium leptoderma]|uniref:Protein phosphatase 4 core regulatory subunit R2 n=1 Tax=Chaetomidium leptoderma TaxID=669021 RepID=A0AAN7A0B7_9PEZI|nr:hypothetical protein C8A00DRAFT_31617 [Chaetomidium leptoderma]
MEMETGDDILRKAALDGSMDYSAWPDLLPTVLAHIEKIAHTEFPIPNIPTPHPPARPPSPRFLAPLPSSDPFEAPDQTEPSSSQGTNKENADPSSPAAARNAPSSTAAPSGPGEQQPPVAATLPKPVADMLEEILSVLRTDFAQYPPHTIQRLAELVLRPRQHYRNLVPYLHALDRVVHVTSGANTYPLPPALPDIGAMSLLANGVGGGGAPNLSIDTATANSLGSDEALGGALLTPIPWLARRTNGGGSDDGSDAGSSSPLSASGNSAQQFQPQQPQPRQGNQLEGRVRTESTETIEGPNGIGSIETVSVSVNGIPSTGAGVALLTQRSVTQGELLRQEQRAGLVPLNQLNRQQQHQQPPQTQGGAEEEEDATMSENVDEEEDEIPHARGPAEIGPADTGPQSAATTNYIAGGGSGGGTMDVQGIDVEAAVGRRVQSPPSQQQQQQQEKDKPATSGSSPEIIHQSPKREAGDSLAPDSPAKRRKEEDDEPAPRGQDQNREEQEAPPKNTLQDQNQKKKPTDDESEPEPMRDAEGDVVLPDAAAAVVEATAGKDFSSSSSSAAAAAAGDDDTDDNKAKAKDAAAAAAAADSEGGSTSKKKGPDTDAPTTPAPTADSDTKENQGG